MPLYIREAWLLYRSHLKTDHQLLSGCREDVPRKVNGAMGAGLVATARCLHNPSSRCLKIGL